VFSPTDRATARTTTPGLTLTLTTTVRAYFPYRKKQFYSITLIICADPFRHHCSSQMGYLLTGLRHLGPSARVTKLSDIGIRGGRVNWYQRLTWYSTDMEGRTCNSRLLKIAFYPDVDYASASPGWRYVKGLGECMISVDCTDIEMGGRIMIDWWIDASSVVAHLMSVNRNASVW